MLLLQSVHSHSKKEGFKGIKCMHVKLWDCFILLLAV